MSDAILRLAVTSAKWDAHARGDSEAATAAEQELMRTERLAISRLASRALGTMLDPESARHRHASSNRGRDD